MTSADRRQGYELALEGLRVVLRATPRDDEDRPHLVRAYRALAQLAGRSALTSVTRVATRCERTPVTADGGRDRQLP